MASYLTDKLNGFRKGVYTIATAGVLVGLGAIYGCDGVIEPVNYDPQITLEASPTSGMVPLESTIRYACTDRNGPEDIAESRLNVGSYTSGATSLDSIFIFTEPGIHTADAYCRDESGREVRAGPIQIQATQPPQPSYSQTARVVNNVNVEHGVTLTNLSEAFLAYLRENGDTVATRTITTPTRAETFTGAHKGNNSFILGASGLAPDTVTATIANYNPTIDLEGLGTDVNEGEQLELDLEGRTSDINPEDNHVPIVSATSLEGKVTPSLSGDSLILLAGNSPGPYEVEVRAGGEVGGFIVDTLRGNVLERPDQIVFWSDLHQGTGELYVGDLIKTAAGRDTLVNTKRVTNNNNNDIWPVWSPDGKYLVWSANRPTPDGWFALYMVDPDKTDGDDETRLTPFIEGFSAYDPVWCNNGQIYFNFLDRESSTQGIARVSSDGTNLEKIIEEPFDGRISERPACSPDGSQIAFVSFRDGNPEIYVSDSAGNNERNIINNPAKDVLPFWSSDGNIFFRSNRSGSADIYRTNPDETGVVRITDRSGIVTDPTVSPDGTLLALAYDLSLPNHQIFIMKPDGTGGWVQLTFEGASRYPAFRPRQ